MTKGKAIHLAAAIVTVLVASPTLAGTSPEKEAEFQFVVQATKMVKSGTKNPASFSLVDASAVEAGAACITFRGTNSYNATVVERAVVRRNLTKGAWNKDCGGKPVTDLTRLVRQAI